MSAEHIDPVEYVVTVRHWQDGEIDVEVTGVGSDESDRIAVAHALRKAAYKVETGKPVDLWRLS